MITSSAYRISTGNQVNITRRLTRRQGSAPFNAEGVILLAPGQSPERSTTWIEADPVEIRRAWELLCKPYGITELRAIKTPEGTRCGYYNDRDAFVRDAVFCSNRIVSTRPGLAAVGVYVLVNRCHSDLLARSCNQLRYYVKDDDCTKDDQIVEHRWLPIDIDYKRASGISATDSEHEAALKRAREVRDYLCSEGWPDPLFNDSGNGAHLLYPVSLPNSDDNASGKLLKSVLEALNRKFHCDHIKVDTVNYNPARIWKLPGSVARKGSHMVERPHRLTRILEIPKWLK